MIQADTLSLALEVTERLHDVTQDPPSGLAAQLRKLVDFFDDATGHARPGISRRHARWIVRVPAQIVHASVNVDGTTYNGVWTSERRHGVSEDDIAFAMLVTCNVSEVPNVSDGGPAVSVGGVGGVEVRSR